MILKEGEVFYDPSFDKYRCALTGLPFGTLAGKTLRKEWIGNVNLEDCFVDRRALESIWKCPNPAAEPLGKK